MRIVLNLLLVFAGVAVLSGAWLTVDKGAVVRERNRQIERSDFVGDSLRAEKRKLQDRIDEVGREMAALPDSLAKLRTGYAVKESQKIAKQEAIYDNLIKRERNVERIHKQKRDEALSFILRWDGVLAGVALILMVTYVLLRKRVG